MCWFFVVVANIIVEVYLQRNFSLLPVRNVTNRENANSFANLIRAIAFRTQQSKNKPTPLTWTIQDEMSSTYSLWVFFPFQTMGQNLFFVNRIGIFIH